MVIVKPLIHYEKMYQSLRLEQELKTDFDFKNELHKAIRKNKKIVRTSKGNLLFCKEKSLGITTIIFEDERRKI